MPAGHPLARRRKVRIAQLADAVFISGPEGAGWSELTLGACRELGGFDPRVRHRTNDGIVTQYMVERGLGIALLPDLVTSRGHPGVVVRDIAEGDVHRTIFAATRTADAQRPAVKALLAAVREAAARI